MDNYLFQKKWATVILKNVINKKVHLCEFCSTTGKTDVVMKKQSSWWTPNISTMLKKTWQSRLNVKTMLTVFIDHWGLVYSELFRKVKEWIKNSTWPIYGVYKQCKNNDRSLGRNIAGLFTKTKLPQTWQSLSTSSYREMEYFHSHSTVLISHQQTFPCSQKWKLV